MAQTANICSLGLTKTNKYNIIPSDLSKYRERGLSSKEVADIYGCTQKNIEYYYKKAFNKTWRSKW